MKLVFTNVNPHKKFNKEKSVLIKLQIDNCLALGWKAEDILLATNFEYEYRGVKSIIVKDDLYCGINDRRYAFKVSTHILIVSYLLEQRIIDKNTLYWYHDLDAYQEQIITEEELGLEDVDLGLTDYGWSPKWNLGSFFFKESAKDILWLLRDTINKEEIPDERALTMLVANNLVKKERYKKLNITYNFGMRHIPESYKMADKPLKVVHFHPCYSNPELPDTTMNMFMYGKNPLGIVLMTDRLIKLFGKYGFDYPYGTECTYGDFMRSIDYD